MANTAQTKKRARQNDTQRIHNASLRSTLRTALKKITKAILSGDKKVAKKTFDENMPVIDRIADKKIIHKNKAARHKWIFKPVISHCIVIEPYELVYFDVFILYLLLSVPLCFGEVSDSKLSIIQVS